MSMIFSSAELFLYVIHNSCVFFQILTSNIVFSAPMTETYQLLGLDPKETTTLEVYLQEYYTQILKKLKELKATSKQGDYYL